MQRAGRREGADRRLGGDEEEGKATMLVHRLERRPAEPLKPLQNKTIILVSADEGGLLYLSDLNLTAKINGLILFHH